MQMRLSVCLRGSAIFFFKEMDKVVGVFIADFQGDLVDLFWVESSRVSAASILFLLRYFRGGRPKAAENS